MLLLQAEPLQDVVGKGVQGHDSANLFAAPYVHLPQVPVPPPGMDAFEDHADGVLRLAGLTRHPGSPSQFPRPITATRLVRINAALGLPLRQNMRQSLRAHPVRHERLRHDTSESRNCEPAASITTQRLPIGFLDFYERPLARS